MRVRLRPTPVTCADCRQHPERQFTQWFTRQSGANPGFPAMVKSILLVVSGETDCPACQQSLRRFLQRFQLAGKLQIRHATPTPACACRTSARAAGQPVQTELDRLLVGNGQQAEGEFEGEWYKRLAAPLLAGALTFASPNDSVLKPVIDTTKAWVQGSKDERERRRKIEEDATARRKQAKRTQQETDEYRVLDEIMAGEFELEQEYTAQDVIHPNIDVHAQYAIQRMLKSPDPAARADGAQMLAAVKSGLLDGIYKEDQQVPAMWARKGGLSWWQLIPPGQDASRIIITSNDPENKEVIRLIVFRNSVRSNPQRLDPALRQSWQKMKQFILLPGTVLQ